MYQQRRANYFYTDGPQQQMQQEQEERFGEEMLEMVYQVGAGRTRGGVWNRCSYFVTPHRPTLPTVM